MTLQLKARDELTIALSSVAMELHDELCSDLNLLQNSARCCCSKHSIAITAH